jgi:hypothetical protein
MNAADFAERLPKARRAGAGWLACCPAHEDHEPSLSINTGDDGKILLKCHAQGCDVEAIVRAAGLEMKDLWPEQWRPTPRAQRPAPAPAAAAPPAPPPLSREKVESMASALRDDAAAWRHATEVLKFSPGAIEELQLGLHVAGGRRWLVYPHRARGVFTFASCRSIEGKKDFIRMPAGQQTALYQGDALQDGGTALVLEGERDVAAALTMGLGDGLGAAVVGMPGAEQVKLAARSLATQQRIYLCTDADKAGDQAAEKLAAELGPKRCLRIRFGHHKDLGDILAQLGPVDGLAEALRPFSVLPGLPGNSHARMTDMAAGEYEPAPLIRTGINALDVALKGGIPLNKLTVIAARTSHGKTATTVRLAVNMALTGRRVLVMWCEDEEVEFDLRALAVLAHTPFPAVLDAYRAKEVAAIWARVPDVKKRQWRQNCATVRLDRPSPAAVADLVRSENGATVLLDHLGEVNWGDGKKHELIGDGLRLIRKAAIDAKCLFVGMAQLNRDWDRRKASSDNPEKVRPCLSDIENSGQIEQVARVCIIAEKGMSKSGEDEVPNGEYRYHVFKPSLATAICRWHEDTATPDNMEPVKLAPIPRTWTENDTDEAEG